MSERFAMVEALEDRRLMSAATMAPLMSIPTSKAGSQQAAAAAAYQRQVAHSIAVGKAAGISPSVVGTWKGKAKFMIVVVKKTVDLTVEITSVTATTATGTITVDGHSYSGTLKGVTRKNEEFSYTYTKGKDSVTVNGLLNGLNTAATGTIKAKYAGWSINGTFNMTKVVSA